MASTKDRQKPLIECKPNGPYRVKDLENLQNSKGEELPIKPMFSLCRCGGSANKPFCDGTHAKINFSSEKETDSSKDKRDNYVGQEITIHDNRGICAHAGFCTTNLASVFKLNTEPWINPGGAAVEAIVETIRKCPSGALSYSIEEVEHRDQNREPLIKVSKDGPYYVTGGIELKDEPRGERASTEHYALCRCGGSKNKPYCDGTHWTIKFKDDKN